MAECGNHATQRVKRNKAPMAHRIFDVIGENPQIKHIADQMHPSAMEKHAANQAEGGWDDGVLGRKDIVTENDGGNCSELIHEDTFRRDGKRKLIEEHRHACDDEGNRDDGLDGRGIVVMERNHRVPL